VILRHLGNGASLAAVAFLALAAKWIIEHEDKNSLPGTAPHEGRRPARPTDSVACARQNDLHVPMHPEVQQDHPGDCPKCGMTLERKTVTAGTDDEENTELRDMTKRFWIGAVLTLPVFFLAMAHMIPVLGRQGWVNGDVSRWMQFALATPVVCWRAGRSSSAAGAPSCHVI